MNRIGRYELLEPLARGASGVVFRARDPQGREVALKRVTFAGPGAGHQRRRFAREGAALRRLRHPGVVRVHDVGEAEGAAFLVMDLLPGGTLQDRLDRAGPLPVREAARQAASLATALEVVHAAGLLHRDLKPANVLLDGAGDPVLTDFGLVKDLDPALSRLSRTGVFLGTPGYWSPEQARGELDRLDARADVYGLGALLYALLTGRPPLVGESLSELLRATERHEVVPPRALRPDVPQALERICLRCLEPEPGRRYLSARALRQELERFLGAGPASRSGRAGLVASGLLLLGALAAAGVLRVGGASPGPGSPAPRPHAPASPAPEVAAPATGAPLDAPAPTGAPVASPLPAGAREAHDWRDVDDWLAVERYVEALAACERRLLVAPDDSKALERKAAALYGLRRHGEVVQLLDGVLAARPDSFQARKWRGMARRMLHDYAGAVADLERATQLAPSVGLPWTELGIAREELGELEAALADHARGLELSGETAYALMNRGNAYAKLGRPHEAQADYDRALELNPGYAFGYFARGALYLSLGNPDQAGADFAEAVRCDPGLGGAWYGLGIASRRLGRPADAVTALERALALDPPGSNRDAIQAELDDTRAALERR